MSLLTVPWARGVPGGQSVGRGEIWAERLGDHDVIPATGGWWRTRWQSVVEHRAQLYTRIIYITRVLSQLVVSACGAASLSSHHHPLSSAAVCVLSGLMYEEEGALIELMMCAIRQAAQATPPVGRTQGKKVVTHTHTHRYMIILCSLCLWWNSGARGREKCHSLFLPQMYHHTESFKAAICNLNRNKLHFHCRDKSVFGYLGLISR